MTNSELQALLASLSLEEKIAQLQQLSPGFYGAAGLETGPIQHMGITEETVYQTTSVLNVFGADKLNAIQKEHMEKAKHPIPLLFMADIIHGYRTILPIPLAQGCSFRPDLVKAGASVAAKESCASGLHVTFSPMVDLVRDARWGRVLESTGEDPYLNSVYAKAMVEGYQGESLLDEGTIAACVKHFAAYGAPVAGKEYNSVDVSERALRQDYLPSYKAAVDAGAATLMTSFNSVAGVPSTGNKWLCRDVLRKEWGFDGVVITDWGSSNTLIAHAVAKDQREAAKLSIEAGVDIEMCTSCYIRHLKELIESGEVPEALLDEAVMRVLELKNKLGLFENPYRYTDAKRAEEVIRCEEHLAVARELVAESSVLLKNDNLILPLNTQQKIAFIGPYTVEKRLNGAWSVLDKNEDSPTLKETLEKRYPEAGFLFEEGAKIFGQESRREAEFLSYEMDDAVTREEKMQCAVETAKAADVVVLAIGEHFFQAGEARSRGFIDLPAIQLELLRRVSAVNSNVVVLLFNGRPLDLREVEAHSKAILDVWFPGTMGTEAITDMIFGLRAPGGRLAMSFPYCVGQVPVYYNYLPTDHPYNPRVPDAIYASRYIDIPNDPLYAFGYGLTYTEFSYSPVTLSSKTLKPGETLTASVTVTNIGSRRGSETVQLYLRDRVASVSRPVKELKGFEKISLEPGESKCVDFPVSEEDLKFYDINLDYVSEPGEFWVFIGPDSRVLDHESFTFEK